MVAHARPETELIRALLSDGEWHTLDEIVSKCGHVITPGRAVRERERVAEYSNSKSRRAGRGSGVAPVRSTEFVVAVGRRVLVREATRSVLGKDDARGERRRNASGQIEVRLINREGDHRV